MGVRDGSTTRVTAGGAGCVASVWDRRLRERAPGRRDTEPRRSGTGGRRILAGLAVLAVASLAAASPAPTPTPTPQPAAPAQALPGAQHLLQLIELQKQQIEEQERLLAAQQKQLEAMKQSLEALNRRLQELEAKAGEATTAKDLEARMAAIEGSVQAQPELPPDVVSAGDFPGSFRVPGSDVAMKIGGIVWTSLINTFDALGSDDRFLTYSIPTEGTPEAGKGRRLSLWAGASRFSFDVRTPTELGQMRAFIEGDFAGENRAFRLRHAYGQYGHFLIGQTWSTFSDPDADNLDIDFEGINAENVQRQAQVRYFTMLREGLRLGVAVEYPTASITGGQAVNQVPDLVGRLVRQLPRGGHLQAAVVLRQVRGEIEDRPNVVESAFAWGLSASGVVSVPRWNEQDRLIFQVNAGKGIARYINDLNSAGGQDAIFTPEGELRVLGAYGYYVDYEHNWGRRTWLGLSLNDLRSSLIWGHVRVSNLQEQSGDAYHKTDRLSLNLVWSPIPRVDLGTEFLWGRRENRDGSAGTARQFQLRMRFLF